MQKRSWKQMLVLLLAVCLFSTVSPELVSSAASTQKVQISARKMTLIKGQKKTLKLKGNRKKVKWSSTKKAVAAVSAKGVVTARKAGTTVIKAKVGTKTYSCKVIVEAPKLNKTSITLKEGSSCQLKMLGTRPEGKVEQLRQVGCNRKCHRKSEGKTGEERQKRQNYRFCRRKKIQL